MRKTGLGIYVYTSDDALVDRLLDEMVSGGVCVNVAAAHATLPSLAFGGIGDSGSGRHHGEDGFREFSNHRAVFTRGPVDRLDSFVPPYGAAARAVVTAALGSPDA